MGLTGLVQRLNTIIYSHVVSAQLILVKSESKWCSQSRELDPQTF